MKEPFGVYLHVPWCARRCSYCDFYAKVTRDPQVLREGGKALLQALERALGQPAWTGSAGTLYLGGGTPSLMDRDFLLALKGLLADRLLPGAEVSLEANPEHLTPEYCDTLAEAGILRVSLGGQAFDRKRLHFLGREHDAAGLRAAMRNLRASGLKNISLDLICQLPEETTAELDHELDGALELEPEHLSVYGLGIEAGTRLAVQERQGRFQALEASRAAERYEHVRRRLGRAGYEHYEISSFARPGLESRHNRAYWEGRDCLAVGPSAVAWLGAERAARAGRNAPWGLRRKTRASWHLFEQAVKDHAAPPCEEEPLDRDQALLEALYLGLRWRGGVDLQVFASRFGKAEAEGVLDAAKEWPEAFQVEEGRLYLFEGQRVLLDEWVLKLARD